MQHQSSSSNSPIQSVFEKIVMQESRKKLQPKTLTLASDSQTSIHPHTHTHTHPSIHTENVIPMSRSPYGCETITHGLYWGEQKKLFVYPSKKMQKKFPGLYTPWWYAPW